MISDGADDGEGGRPLERGGNRRGLLEARNRVNGDFGARPVLFGNHSSLVVTQRSERSSLFA
jgi:hypothetical protein